MVNFNDMFLTLYRAGVLDSLLPFLLVFTIVYAILMKAKVFGDKKKNFNVTVALVIGLAVVIPHLTGTYPSNGDVVEIMNKALPNISIFIVAIVMVLIMVGIFGGEASLTGNIAGWVVILAIVAVGYIFGAAAGWWGNITGPLGFLNDSDFQALIIIILVFGVIVWFITRDDDGKKEGGTKFVDGFKQLFGGS